MQTTAPTLPRTRRWNHAEYYRMADLGFFRGQRVELIGGRIIKMAPQRDLHAICIGLAVDESRAVFGKGFWIRAQLPLHLSNWSEPEPDISVVPGGPRDYTGKGHPRTALLIIEVSETSLRFDRRRKLGLYARFGIRDYWIINLVDHQLEVHRDPIPDSSHPFGHRYATAVILKPGESIQPLVASGTVQVSDLLP